MAKVVYTEWSNRSEYTEETEIVGVYEDENKAYRDRYCKEKELEEEGYDTEEDVRVWIDTINIVRDEAITNDEIELVMNALAGYTILTSSKFADKVERILKKYVV